MKENKVPMLVILVTIGDNLLYRHLLIPVGIPGPRDRRFHEAMVSSDSPRLVQLWAPWWAPG